MRTWTPDAATWDKIKQSSVKSPATIAISGFGESDSSSPVSTGSVTISTSVDPVGAPVFYRDVPLMTSPHTEKGSIQPLPTSALPLIKWRLRDISQPQSRTVMEGLYTCANCHSFSRDGKTLGLDVDGPQNDKSLYALVPISKNMTIRNQDVIRWKKLQETPGAGSYNPSVSRFGFMSQISPDGRFVVTSIRPPGAPVTPITKLSAPSLASPIVSSASTFRISGLRRSSIPRAAYSPGTTARKESCALFPAPTIPNMSTPARSGHPMEST